MLHVSLYGWMCRKKPRVVETGKRVVCLCVFQPDATDLHTSCPALNAWSGAQFETARRSVGAMGRKQYCFSFELGWSDRGIASWEISGLFLELAWEFRRRSPRKIQPLQAAMKYILLWCGEFQTFSFLQLMHGSVRWSNRLSCGCLNLSSFSWTDSPKRSQNRCSCAVRGWSLFLLWYLLVKMLCCTELWIQSFFRQIVVNVCNLYVQNGA